jgi:hypothetical protein
MRIDLVVKALCVPILFAVLASPTLAKPCIAPPLSAADLDRAASNLEALVAPTADARAIETQVRDIVGSDSSFATKVVALARGVSPRFRTAIAAGLAQAAVACETVDQEAALTIQQAVAGLDDGEFQNAFAAVAGDLSTAAAEAAGTAATGSVGSVVVTNHNGASPLSTAPGGGRANPIFQINSTGFITRTSTSNSSGTASAASPVSATR